MDTLKVTLLGLLLPYLNFADLLRRTLGIDLFTCPCGGRRSIESLHSGGPSAGPFRDSRVLALGWRAR